MVESDHGEAVEDTKITTMPGGGDIDAKKMELVGKRQREDSSEDENHDLPNKRQRSDANDRTSEPDRDTNVEPIHKANGSAALNDDTMNVDEEELSDENSKITSAKSREKMDGVDSSEEKDINDKTRNDASINNDSIEQNRESVENADGKETNLEKNDASSEEKADDNEDEDEEIDDEGDLSKDKESMEKQPGKPSVSKSRTKDPEVVDGLEMSVECASDKEGSSSEAEEDDEEKKKLRPKTIIVKAKPNDSELDASTSEGEKSEDIEKKEEKKVKRTSTKVGRPPSDGKGRKRGKKKGFTKVGTSGSDDSDDNASEDEDYSPRTKKKMKKSSPAKKSPGKTPGKRRGRQPKKLVKESEEEQSDEHEDDDANLEQRSEKIKEKTRKKSVGSEDEDKSDEDSSGALRKNGKKKSKARPEDDKRIQALKKYFPMAGIPIKSYEKFWAGCKTNTARLARMKEALALHGVVGRPTMEKCKKAKARMELKKDVDSLSPTNIMSEGRVTRARGGKKATSPKEGDTTPSRREGRGGNKRVSNVFDSESE